MSARFDMSACQEMLKLSPDEVAERLKGGEVRERVQYEGIKGVTQYYNADVFPGRVYVSDKRVEMVYVPRTALRDVTAKEIASHIKGRTKSLRSRAGKEYTHIVDANDGVAYSTDDDEVVILEVFPPRPFKEYEEEIYEDPGEFIR